MNWSMFPRLILLPVLVCLFRNDSVSATTLSFDSEGRHRQQLPTNLQSIIQYLQVQHSLGNRNSQFTICGTTASPSGTVPSPESFHWRLNMQEVPLHRFAIPPDSNFSVYGREERAVGDLGYSFLSVDLSRGKRSPSPEASYAFLIVDWSSHTLGGVVMKSGEVAYVDEHSFFVVEPYLYDPDPGSAGLIFSPPNLQFQINLAININRSLVRQIGGGSLCHTIAYLNSLFTAINKILEYEVHARLNVEAINQTVFYDINDEVLDQNLDSLGHLLSNQANGRARNIDIEYVFLGRGSSKSDPESNPASMHTTLFSTVCGPQQALGMIIDWRGNAVRWGEGWFEDLNQLLTLVGRNIGSKVTDASLLSEHIASIDRVFSGANSEDNRDFQSPPTAFGQIRSFLVTTQQQSSCSLAPSNFDDVETVHHYEKNECQLMSPTSFNTEARAFMSESAITSYFPTSATISPASTTSSPISSTNSPIIATKSPTTIDTATIATNSPTEGLFKTMAPIAEPTTQPTISGRPTGEGLPTASNAPITATPVKPPTPRFPTYAPTDGSALPTIGNGNQTYPPTLEVLYPTPMPSISRGPSFAPSSMPSVIPSVAPTTEPSLSLIPTEFYRPSAIPSQSSSPSAMPSLIPTVAQTSNPSLSLIPTELSRPSAIPSQSSSPSVPPSESKYTGDLTNNIASSDAVVVSSVGCPSSASASADLIFDGTTEEFTCGEQASLNPAQRLLAPGFIINLTHPSLVEKLRVYAGYNCIECDAVTYTIQGLTGNDWELISSGDLPWKGENPGRNEAGKAIRNSTYYYGDDAMSFTEISLNNTRTFSEYLLTFPETRNVSYALVVAEVELPGRTFDSPTSKPAQVASPTPTRLPTLSTSRPTPRSTGAKTSKPTRRRTTRPTRRRNKRTRKPTPRPFRQRSKTSSKTTKSKSSKGQTSDGFPGSKWDDIFFIETYFIQNSTFSDTNTPQNSSIFLSSYQ
eukprot:CCRYP_007979-RA/>CCRYP_007979-RA protein AED:0.07 eAED:0.07 QI:248/1/1/1/1/1/2/213/975